MGASLSRHLLFLLLPLLTTAAAVPPTPVRDVVDEYFGTKVVDPYRWLEKTSDPEVEAWMKAQNDHTHATLARIPGRDQLLGRIKALDNAGAAVSWLQVWGGRYFYYKTEPDSDNRRLYVRDPAGSERLLIDPERLTTADGTHFSIDYFQPSIDGKYVAYGLSRGGSEASVLHVLETATGKVLSDTIDRAQAAQPSWRPDGKSFFYTRMQKLTADAPPTARYQKMRTYLHKLGDDPEKDVPLFGYGVSSEVKVLEDDFPFLTYSPGAPKYLVGVVNHGVKNEVDLYVIPFENTLGAKARWKKIADETDAITGFDVHGDEIYLLCHKDVSRFKVLRTSLVRPDVARAVAVVPASEVVITYIAAADDALYVRDLDAGLGRLRHLAYKDGTVQPVNLPFEGAIQALVTNPTTAGAWLQLTSWTKSPLWYAFNSKEARMTDTKLVASSPVDFSKIESKEVKARSADGTMVPLSIVHRRGLKMDETVALDSTVNTIVKKWIDIADASYAALGFHSKQIVMESGEPLDGRETEVRSKQTTLTKLITDAMSFACPQAEVVLMNAGSIRVDDILYPPVSQYDIIRTLPFGGAIREADMKGRLLLQVLEAGRKNAGIGGFLQVGKVLYNPLSGKWSIGNAPVGEDKIYRVALSDFLLTGKEANLDFLNPQNADIVKVYEAVTATEDGRSDIRLAVVQYLQQTH